MSGEKEEVPISQAVATASEAALSPADIQKQLGNDAFAAKKFEEAIGFYSEAIKLDPDNAIYYSNRSACYAFLKNWQGSIDDAILCLSKDSKSPKGYYRLAQAQIELGQLDDAEVTIIAALKLDPENEPILKMRRTIAAKRAGKTGAIPKNSRELDESQKKELMELQDQLNNHNRDLRLVQVKLNGLQREIRSGQVTSNYLETLKETQPDATLYRSVGKAFVRTEKSLIEERLNIETELNTKTQRDLGGQKEFLERRITSTTQHMKDILTGM